MNRKLMITIAGAALAATSCASLASAQDRSQLPGRYFDPTYQAPPLVVRRGRPFTDSGTQVPVGYENDYLLQQTTLHEPIYNSFRPDAFGQDVLPGRLGGIGD